MRTSIYSILCIVIRLGAVCLAVSTVVTIPTLWYYTSGNAANAQTPLIAFAVASLALSALLWIYPGLLARIAAGKSSQDIFESPLSGEDLQQIALSVAGMWLAMQGIADIAGVGARVVIETQMTDVGFRALWVREFPRLVPLAIKIGLGIALALGARGWIGWVRTLRERGLPPVTDARTDEPGSDAVR